MNCGHCQNQIPDSSEFCNHCGMSARVQPKQPMHSVYRYLIVLVALVAAFYIFVRYEGGRTAADRLVASVAHTPITLADETQNLSASSWRAIAVQAPYNGNLDVELEVVRGNPLDVILIPMNELDTLRANSKSWGFLGNDQNFSAVKTTTYKRDGRVLQGNYYLVLRDPTLGILSASATDVQVKIVLNP